VRILPSFQKFLTVKAQSEMYPTATREAKAVTRNTWISIGALSADNSECRRKSTDAAMTKPIALTTTTCRAFSRKMFSG
jgi:hypothetical protein